MSQVIHKFPLASPGFWRVVSLPANAQCVKTSTRTNILQAWFMLDPDAPRVNRHFTCVATGDVFPDELTYIDTIFDGGLVWHVLEDKTLMGQEKDEGKDYG